LEGAAALDLATIYAAHFVDVSRWVRALGANDGDVEDLAQEVFIIVRRKLGTFDGRNLCGFLYRIAQRTARDHRQSAWYRAWTRSRNPIEGHALATSVPTGLDAVEELQRRRTLRRVLAQMSEKRRTVLVLFELEGYSGEEIARIQSVPVRTVWTRLHHARKDFSRIAAELPGAPAGGEK
jgi:RNA polymerase sigma-70 factor (ECF subfamily)